MRQFIVLIKFVLILLIFSACGNNTSEKEKIIIFHAGSLSVPFKQMKDAFEKKNPGVEILLEPAGSVNCARKITELKKDCDIMASADFSIIDELLIPDYASWNIKFATNEMAIVFNDASKYSNEINSENWHVILLKDDVIFGRSDPNSDPCGYRAVLVTQLAEKFYNKPGLSGEILAKDTKYLRPKEVDLLSLLETHTIDYVFLYRSVAEQHDLKYIILPDTINLKKPELKVFYENAKVEITGKEPGALIVKTGQAMVYGITVLKNAPNKELAIEFVDFVLSKNGGVKIMEENGQPSIVPSYSETYNEIPKKLKQYSKPN
ncbi:MAG: tungstate ABC transporter substrate-binding protein WtpA [Saprospiraceae bacterium]|nr:tungstate ABC transporter substrate-binding protein WtpA [Saprospiraceae bacterium]